MFLELSWSNPRNSIDNENTLQDDMPSIFLFYLQFPFPLLSVFLTFAK